MDVELLMERFWGGDLRAVSRIITLVEDGYPEGEQILGQLYPRTGQAHRVGITGPPGVGKSTLVDRLVVLARKRGLTVGVVAVDPSSPFTGGAILGDRVRMQSMGTDQGVFIRSMATRGSLGGLARATGRVVDVLDAFGKDLVLVETVGVGQTELDIVKVADTTVIIFGPEFGDSIQALKAGLMEIGDMFVVNKADREGADQAAMDLERILELRSGCGEWVPPVLKTVATINEGIEELFQAIEFHRRYLREKGFFTENRRERIRTLVAELVEEKLRCYLWDEQGLDGTLGIKAEEVMHGGKSPYQVAEEILREAGLLDKGVG